MAGTEDWSTFNEGDQPTTFAGGTVSSGYGSGIRVIGSSWFDPTWPDGTKVFNPIKFIPATLTFASGPVGSLTLEIGHDVPTGSTITAFDAADAVVDSEVVSTGFAVSATVSSSSNNIKYVTIMNGSPSGSGAAFTNLSWTCNP